MTAAIPIYITNIVYVLLSSFLLPASYDRRDVPVDPIVEHGAGWQVWSEAACGGEFELDGGGEVRVNRLFRCVILGDR